jgi:hypothetical protein
MNLITDALDNGTELSSDQWAMIQEWGKLRCAWYELSKVAPELTKYLENGQERIEIAARNLHNEAGHSWVVNIFGGRIGIDKKTIADLSTESIAALLGHEALHAAFAMDNANYSIDSYAQEAFCYSMQYQVEVALTGNCNNQLAVACQYFTPDQGKSGLDKQLRDSLVSTLRSYYNFFWCRPWWYSTSNKLIQTAQKVWFLPKLQPVPWTR